MAVAISMIVWALYWWLGVRRAMQQTILEQLLPLVALITNMLFFYFYGSLYPAQSKQDNWWVLGGWSITTLAVALFFFMRRL